MSETTWLASLKPGDRVAVCSQYQRTYIARVARLTTTQIVVSSKTIAGEEYETRFRKKDARRIGEYTYDAPYLLDPTCDHVIKDLAEGRCVRLRMSIKDACGACKDEATLRAALAVLTPPESFTTNTTSPGGASVVTSKES